MKHAEEIAERLNYFDVTPTIKLNPISVSGDPAQMLKSDARVEEEAILLYKNIISRHAQKR